MERNTNKNKILRDIKYCTRCCMPETQEGIIFDGLGICQACQSSEQKIHINWVEREQQLKKILSDAKSKAGNNYDCILPISGGKDSFFQAHVLTQVYGMKPLAVTFSHNWFSETGLYNLHKCLESFNLDHIMFTPGRNLVNKIAKRSLSGIGDSCWHCHSGVSAFPMQIATKFNIPLLIYGESISEASGRASYNCPVRKFDRDYGLKVSSKLNAREMVDENLTERDLFPFELPDAIESEKVGVSGIHLGDFIFWDEERQTEFVRDIYGWKETEVEGAYKGFKSVECIMPGLHDFTCYLKRGYGRSTYQASVDVRNGLMTREEGFEISKIDTEIPHVLEYYLKITGMSLEDFYEIMEKHKHPRIKDIDLPLTRKTKENAEVLKPFVEQLFEKYSKRKDPREKNSENE